jgi:hypothetical protein
MGLHSGPVNVVSDVNERENVAGVGINLAQRVMDCGIQVTSFFRKALQKIWRNSLASAITSTSLARLR